MRKLKSTKIGTSHEVAFSPDGTRLGALSRDVVLWDLDQRKKAWRSHPFSHPSHLSFSPTGDLLAVKNTSGSILILEAATGEVACDFENDEVGEGSNVAFSPCGEYVVDGSWDGVLSVRTANSGRLAFRQGFRNQMIVSVQPVCNGQLWVVAHTPKATTHRDPPAPDYFSLWTWPFEEGGFTPLPCCFPFLRASAATNDGSLLAIVHGAPPTALDIVRIPDGTAVASLSILTGGSGSSLRWSHDGKFLGSVQDGTVVFYEAPGISPVGEVALPFPCDVAFSPADAEVALGSWSAGLLLSFQEILGADGAG